MPTLEDIREKFLRPLGAFVDSYNPGGFVPKHWDNLELDLDSEFTIRRGLNVSVTFQDDGEGYTLHLHGQSLSDKHGSWKTVATRLLTIVANESPDSAPNKEQVMARLAEFVATL